MERYREISKAAIRRLRLKQGDIVLVRDHGTMEALMRVRVEGIPGCPIVMAPNGVHRLSKEYLAKLVSHGKN